MQRVLFSHITSVQKKVFSSWFFACLFSFSLLFSIVWLARSVDTATPPSIITYQGKLLENGASVTTTKAMAFVIYDAASGGTALYTAAGTLPATSTMSVTPTQGIFSVDLGGSGTNALDSTVFQDNDELYLEVVVDGTTLTPRKRLTASPYAVNSTYLNGAQATSTPQSTTYIPMSDVDGSFIFNTTTFGGGSLMAYETTVMGAPIATFDAGTGLVGSAGVFRAMSSHPSMGAAFVLYPNSTTTIPGMTSSYAAVLGMTAANRPQLTLGSSTDAAIGAGYLHINDGSSIRVRLSASVSEDAYIRNDLLVGATSESILNTNFIMGGDDFYVHGDSGLYGNIFSGGILDIAGVGTSTFAGSIDLSSGNCFAVDGTCISGGSSQWSDSGSDIYFSSGNVGIGTSTPGYELVVDGDTDVTGVIRLGGTQVMYRPSTFTNTLYVGNGGANLSYVGGEDGYYSTFVGISAGLQNTAGRYNTGVGSNALQNNTEGNFNSAFGQAALSFNTLGSSNSAFGMASMQGNTSGNFNSAFGTFSLINNTSGSNNNAFGYSALYANTEGIENNAFGINALYSNTTGTYNIAIGSNAMYANTYGYSNIGIGTGALSGNIGGSSNIAIGGSALANNTEGFSNIAVGVQAMAGNIDGTFNSAFGLNALNANTSSDQLSAFGAYALFSNTTGSSNDAFGYGALQSNTVGYNNTAFGTRALQSNIDGVFNTAFGADSLLTNTSGYQNVAFGYGSLYSNTTGANNLGLGMQTLYNNTTGQRNIGVGLNALYNLDGTDDNMAIGWAAMQFATSGIHNIGIGNNVLGSFTSGSGNTVLGYQTGSGLVSGSYNTIIGANVTGLDAALSNNIIIADGQGNQRIRIDNGNIGLNTTTPQYPLTVVGHSYFLDMIEVAGAGTSTILGNLAVTGTIYSPSIIQSGGGFEVLSDVFTGSDTVSLIMRESSEPGFETPGLLSSRFDIFYNSITSTPTSTPFGPQELHIDVGSGTGYLDRSWTATGLFRVQNTSSSLPVIYASYIDQGVGINTNTISYPLNVWRQTDGVVAAFTDSDATCTVDPSDGDFSCTSDRDLKTNITVMGTALDSVMRLSPVTYNWNTDPNGDVNYGFIAQEVEAIFPRLVGTGASGYKTLSQIGLIPFLTKAIQEQQLQIQTLSSALLQGSSADLTSGSFEGTLRVAKHVSFGEDTVGQVKLLAGATSVRVTFTEYYEHQPIVTVSPLAFISGQYRVAEENEEGFTLELSESQPSDVVFNWHAFAGEGAKLTVSDGSFSDITLVVVDQGEESSGGGSEDGVIEGADIPDEGGGAGEVADPEVEEVPSGEEDVPEDVVLGPPVEEIAPESPEVGESEPVETSPESAEEGGAGEGALL